MPSVILHGSNAGPVYIIKEEPPSEGKSTRALLLQGIRGDRFEPLHVCCVIVGFSWKR